MPPLPTRLLLVDNDERLRTSLSAILVGHGHSVRTASAGFYALAAIRQETPDILLSDLRMPHMSGFELLSVVRRRYPSTWVIAMSGSFSGWGIPPGVAADAFYEKGTHPRLLLRIVDAMKQPPTNPAQHAGSDLAAIWIPRNGHDDAEEPYVLLTCTECLRVFRHLPGGGDEAIRETECVFCATRICYAAAPAVNPTVPQSFRRKPGTGTPSTLCLPDITSA